MLIFSLINVAFTVVVGATRDSQNNGVENLVVRTRTGTFIGDLNDTYADVRQFKWIPYAKVSITHNRKALLLTSTAARWQQAMGSSRKTR
jgi:hypothetical protein